MSIQHVIGGVATLSIIAASGFVVGLSQPVIAVEVPDWVLENCVDESGRPTITLQSGAQCDLKNRKSGTCLVQLSHAGQADWDFASCTSKPRNARIVTKAGIGPVMCGETIALKLGTEFYRKCVSPQTIGINICSETASPPQAIHFSWQFNGCTGQLAAGRQVALYNVTRKDSVVYATRPSKVVNTCWADWVKLGQCVTVQDK